MQQVKQKTNKPLFILVFFVVGHVIAIVLQKTGPTLGSGQYNLYRTVKKRPGDDIHTSVTTTTILISLTLCFFIRFRFI